MLIDRVTIRVEGGTGGSGAEAFLRESGNPRGGPAGGDGGDGGDVVLVCDPQLTTLLDLRYRSEYRAGRGKHGEGSNKTGAQGDDEELRVPPGTLVADAETGEPLRELLDAEESWVIARGGRGGRGNARFATATRQAPRYSEPGEEGERRTVKLTLKLIADVGLVGKPNAGKSTFLAAVSAAQPKIADYPFTTLTPNLGVAELTDFRSFVIADIPGIIEGAHEGRGLGHQFLQHIERTRTLAILVSVDDPEPAETYAQLREELRHYSAELASRPHCVVLSKSDLLASGAPPPSVPAEEAWNTYLVSAVAHSGLGTLLEGLWARVRDERFRTDPASHFLPPVAGIRKRPQEDRTTDGKSLGTEEDWWHLVDEDT